jgi:Tfp pilus assembly protein PilZ
MKQKEDDGIEFEAWETSEDIQKISRNSFRIPINELDNVTLQINNHPYEIINITSVGISIYLVNADVFFIGDVIEKIELYIEGERLTFQGRVRHISPKGSDGYLCGIELIETITNSRRILLDYIQKKLNNFLTSSIIKSQS